MNTYRLLQALRNHWDHPVNPIYRAELRHMPAWDSADIDRRSGQLVRVGGLLIGGLVLITGARALTNVPGLVMLSDMLLQATCLSAGGVLLVLLVLLTFLWPIMVALATSDTIVRERERRTWSALLVTPFDWGDLLTAKLASALQWLNRPFTFVWWIQGLLLLLVGVLVFGPVERLESSFSPVIVLILALVAGAQFGIARLQDYSSACVIGLAASIAAESRQMAWTFALIGVVTMVLMRLALAALLLSLLSIPSPQALILLLATGPTAEIALGVPLPLAVVLLILLPLAREVMIRFGYQWVVGQLGLVASSS